MRSARSPVQSAVADRLGTGTGSSRLATAAVERHATRRSARSRLSDPNKLRYHCGVSR
jgi:hypothetical protein